VYALAAVHSPRCAGAALQAPGLWIIEPVEESEIKKKIAFKQGSILHTSYQVSFAFASHFHSHGGICPGLNAYPDFWNEALLPCFANAGKINDQRLLLFYWYHKFW
jgi:hypothetical protein